MKYPETRRPLSRKSTSVEGYNPEAGTLSVIDANLRTWPRKGMLPQEIDDYFPYRLVMNEERVDMIKSIPPKEWESWCTKCAECCVGCGDSRGPKEQCRYTHIDGLCSIYSERENHPYLNCPDMREQMLEGTFLWTAPIECAYWKIFTEVTGIVQC